MFEPTAHELKVMRYLHQRGPMERRSILVDCCAETSLINLRKTRHNGQRGYYQGSNGAAPMIVARWMKRLLAEGLVAERRGSPSEHWEHIDYHLTSKGQSFVRTAATLT
jgi:hypothetical protein